ncbi:MAG: ABC-F family ATP-binding cassette domain-containing protein [Ignavibacteriaceae bacterium]|jgi:ATP-binding cassette subfamily F protein 3
MIDLQNISLQFGGNYLFRDISYKINAGDKISLVGANGTGKSSLLKIIYGTLQPENGVVAKQKRISLGYLPQENILHKGKTLVEEAASALTDIKFLHEKEDELTSLLSNSSLSDEEQNDLVNQLGEVHHKLEELDSYTANARTEKILAGLGFEESDFSRMTDELSGGWQMRIALAKILISQNDVLLMDEPTNHLDLDSLEWLISFLKGYKGALLLVSHDKHFVNEVTNKTLEIFLGKITSFNGKYDAYLKFAEERNEMLEQQYLLQQKKIKETENFIERFRYKATKAKQVQSRIKQLEKVELIELPESKDDITIRFPEPPQSGRINIELKHLSKSYGEKNIFNNLDFTIERGEKIAFVGPNGAGKTTLAKIIADKISFDKGERILGHNTSIAYYAQDVADVLDPDLDILETIEGISEGKTIGQLRSLLGCFLFSGDDVFKKIGVLSGGEKSRVALTKILLTKANLIVLDEPTNHLDISSKEVLQQALTAFNGSLVLVSHDVDFLCPIVNKVIEIKRNSFKIFLDGIDYYLAKREESLNFEEQEIRTKVDSSILTRKDQKRIEAELRQKKFQSTKHLLKEIADLEKEISLLEDDEKKYEADLIDEKIYSNPLLIKQTQAAYNLTKETLQKKLTRWEKLNHNLLEIERRFESPLPT